MDEKRPFAKAALAKDGVFTYIGKAEDVKKLADADAQVLNYGENFVYPGFLESNTHGCLAGYRAIGQADLTKVVPTDYDKYKEIIKDFMAKHPEKEIFLAAGWCENDQYVTKAYLDDICSDRSLDHEHRRRALMPFEHKGTGMGRRRQGLRREDWPRHGPCGRERRAERLSL